MTKKKTGIFYVKNPNAVVVMQQDVEIARYHNVAALVSAHEDGIKALERIEEGLHRAIESQYKPQQP